VTWLFSSIFPRWSAQIAQDDERSINLSAARQKCRFRSQEIKERPKKGRSFARVGKNDLSICRDTQRHHVPLASAIVY
jgi:hypothetical protein